MRDFEFESVKGEFSELLRVRKPFSPPFFLPPSDSLNQSQFAQPSLKPVDTKGFTKHIAVCLKHTQTPKSERFSAIFGPPDSEF